MSLPSTETLDQLDEKTTAAVVAAWERVRFEPAVERLRDKVLNLVPNTVETKVDADFDEHCPETGKRERFALQGAWRLASYTAWATEPGHLSAARRPKPDLVAVIVDVWAPAVSAVTA